MNGDHVSSLRQPGAVLLLSCYELGRPPQALALPLAFLERAGFRPLALDLAVQELETRWVQRARFIGISVPMHTALRLGVKVAQRIRKIHPDCHICFYGHYALLHAKSLLAGLADSVLGGELETELVEGLARMERPPLQGDGAAIAHPAARLERLDFPIPSRGQLPRLEDYAHMVYGGRHVVAGQVEASRGCLHHCGHCPIPVVYGGRIFVIPMDVVLADIRAQVGAGARHISFADADFLNGPTHALRVVRAMHAEFPEMTFDFTAKIEHILQNRRIMPELAKCGALFMVSAVESLSDRVLGILQKGHTRADIDAALQILREAGIVMRPSLMPFTPWSTREDFEALLEFAVDQDLVECIDPVQYTIRLLVPPGSLLLRHPEMRPHLGEFDAEALTYRWKHPDPTMDDLQVRLAGLVEEAVAEKEESATTFARILEFLGLQGTMATVEGKVNLPPYRSPHATRRRERPPRLTEPWFC